MVFSDQRWLESDRAVSSGCLAAWPSQPSTRGNFSAYGTWMMDIAPIALEPRP